jgi:hypothetical protein
MSENIRKFGLDSKPTGVLQPLESSQMIFFVTTYPQSAQFD